MPLCLPVLLRSGPGVICVRLIIRVITSLAPRPGEERKALQADELAWGVPAFAICVLCLSCARLFRLMQKVGLQNYLMKEKLIE